MTYKNRLIPDDECIRKNKKNRNCRWSSIYLTVIFVFTVLAL